MSAEKTETRTLLSLCVEHHPCKRVYSATAVPPDCLSDGLGKCEVYENAIFCPKYGKPVGAIAKYGLSFFVETTEEKDKNEDTVEKVGGCNQKREVDE